MIFNYITILINEFRFPKRSLTSSFVNISSPLANKNISSSKKLAATKIRRAREAERLIINPKRTSPDRSVHIGVNSNYLYSKSKAKMRSTKAKNKLISALKFPNAYKTPASVLLVKKRIAKSKEVLANSNLSHAKPRSFPLTHKTLISRPVSRHRTDTSNFNNFPFVRTTKNK